MLSEETPKVKPTIVVEKNLLVVAIEVAPVAVPEPTPPVVESTSVVDNIVERVTGSKHKKKHR